MDATVTVCSTNGQTHVKNKEFSLLLSKLLIPFGFLGNLNRRVAPVSGGKVVHLNLQLRDYRAFRLQINWDYNHIPLPSVFFFFPSVDFTVD